MSLGDHIEASKELLSAKVSELVSLVRGMGAAQCVTGISANFSGRWRKDRSASQGECYSKQLDLLQIGGIQKACAEKLINGLHIDQKENVMKVQFAVDRVPFYKHTEEFRLGEAVTMDRRDKKAGKQHAVLRAIPEGVQVDIQLDPPFAGSIVETYSIPEDGVLQIKSVTSINGTSLECINVYRKS